VKGFHVSGFWVAVLFSIVLSIIHFLMNLLIGAR
jgi:uncharacterized membrane protein YvlD (DUF360 family)